MSASRWVSVVDRSESFEITVGVVQEQDDHEQHREGEQGVRRIRDAEALRELVETGSPDGEDEDHAGSGEPEDRVALAELSRADELDHDAEQGDGGESGEELDGHLLVGDQGLPGEEADEEGEQHLDDVVERAKGRDRRAAGGAGTHEDRHLAEAQVSARGGHDGFDLGVVVRVVDRQRVGFHGG